MDKFKDFLTDQERKELRGFLNRRDFSGREHGRASAILHLDKGKSVPQFAEITFLDEQTVRNLVNRYKNGGIDGLLKDEYDGRSFKLAPEQRRELQRHLDDNLYMDCQGVISHADAVHPTHNSSPAYGWIRRGQEKELVANSGRQRLNLHAHSNAATNEVIVQRVEGVNKKMLNNRYYATFREFTEEALMFFECLSEYADELRTLLAHNFQLVGQATGKTVTNAY